MTLEQIPLGNLNLTLENGLGTENPEALTPKMHNGLGVRKKSYSISFKRRIMFEYISLQTKTSVREFATLEDLGLKLWRGLISACHFKNVFTRNLRRERK
jgi:hypothetical protein